MSITSTLHQYIHLAKNYKLSFIKKVHEIDNIYSFYFDKQTLQYESGQHFFLHHPHAHTDSRGSMRIMSASSSALDPYLVFTMRVFEDSSSFKKSLMALKAGDTISVRGPSPIHDYFGFENRREPQIYVIGGIGITPIHAILKDCAESGKELHAHILYCNSTDNILFQDQIQKYLTSLPHVTIEYIQSPDRIPATTFAQLLAQYGDTARFILSGSEGFVQYYTKVIPESGVSPKNIFKYLFSFNKSSYQ